MKFLFCPSNCKQWCEIKTKKLFTLALERVIAMGISRKVGAPGPLTVMTSLLCPAPQPLIEPSWGQGEMTGQSRHFLRLPLHPPWKITVASSGPLAPARDTLPSSDLNPPSSDKSPRSWDKTRNDWDGAWCIVTYSQRASLGSEQRIPIVRSKVISIKPLPWGRIAQRLYFGGFYGNPMPY